MSEVRKFEEKDGYPAYRIVGEFSLQQGIERVTAAIVSARQQGLRRLLLNTAGATGFPSPSLGSRYFFVHEWARAAQGQVSIAIVARPEMIDPQKFGVAVATSAGLTTDVFTSEDEAVAWLRRLDQALPPGA